MSIWEMNDRLNHKNPHHLGFRDLIWQFFNEESLKHLHEGDMGLYRNTRLDMYEFLFEEKKYEQAFNLLCEVIAYDLSGMDNSEFSDIDEKFRLQLMLKYDFPYSQSNAKLPPAIKRHRIIPISKGDWNYPMTLYVNDCYSSSNPSVCIGASSPMQNVSIS